MIINGFHFSHDGAAVSYEEIIELANGWPDEDYHVEYTSRTGPDSTLEPGDSIPMYPGLIFKVEMLID